jgi:hypothetical protein
LPVDLTPDGRVARLRAGLDQAIAERDDLREQVAIIPTLYDELASRDEKIARLERTGITELQWQSDRFREALNKIVANGGRGGLKIAQEALDF